MSAYSVSSTPLKRKSLTPLLGQQAYVPLNVKENVMSTTFNALDAKAVLGGVSATQDFKGGQKVSETVSRP